MTVRVLHTADWHLGYKFGAFGEAAAQRLEDQRKAILRIVELAKENAVAAVLISGDLFDSTRPDAQAQTTAKQAFDLLATAGIPAFAIPGTHDHTGVPSPLPCWEHGNLAWFSEQSENIPVRLETDEEDLWLYGLVATPGQPADLPSLRRQDLPGSHMALLHASVIHADGWSVSYKDIPVKPAELAALDLDYIALGHFHQHAPIEHQGKLLGAYAGTPAALRFEETGARYALLVEKNAGGLNIHPLPVSADRCLDERLDAALFTDDAALIAAIARFGSERVYAKIRLTGMLDRALDLPALQAAAGSHFAHLLLLDQTDLTSSQHLQALAAEPTIRGHAITSLRQRLSATTDPHEVHVLKRALQHLLAAFDRHRMRQAL